VYPRKVSGGVWLTWLYLALSGSALAQRSTSQLIANKRTSSRVLRSDSSDTAMAMTRRSQRLLDDANGQFDVVQCAERGTLKERPTREGISVESVELNSCIKIEEVLPRAPRFSSPA